MKNKISVFVIIITFVSSAHSMTVNKIGQYLKVKDKISNPAVRYREQVLQLIEENPDLSYLTFNSPLLEIVKYPELTALVALMLEHKANPNVMDITLFTPLHRAAANNNTEAALLLLKAGANSNSTGSIFESTPLHMAVRTDSNDVVRILLESGAHPNEKDSSGCTPLHEALEINSLSRRNNKNSINLVKLLLQHGADPFCENNNRNNALSIAHKEYTKMFTKHNAEAKEYKEGATPEEYTKIIAKHSADEEEYKKIARLLIAYVGLYTKQSRIARNGLAQVLPTEIALHIASYFPEYAIHR